MSDIRWKNDAIQFPRVIDEAIAAGAFTDDVQEAMSESMGLEIAKIEEVLTRATKAFEMQKDSAAKPKPEKSYKGLSRLEREVDGDYQRDVEKYQEDLWSVCAMDDWEEPGQWWIDNEPLDNVIQAGKENDYYHDILGAGYREQVAKSASDDWESFCDSQSIEPYQIEAYEHWIVSDWFADKLEEKGQMILKDFNGLTIWGRTTTGQSIHLDSVICNIYNELNAGDI